MEYYLTSGLVCTRVEEFENDAEAWNSLRLLMPNKFVTLMKKVEQRVKIVNPKHYIDTYYAKYNVFPHGLNVNDIDYNIDKDSFEITTHNFVPVLEGITSDEY